MEPFPILLPRATCGSWTDPALAAGQGKTCVKKVSLKKEAVMVLCLEMTNSNQASGPSSASTQRGRRDVLL